MPDHHDNARRPELVTVISHARLVDSESEEQIYWRRDGNGLAPGLYVVTWPPGTTQHVFNEDARFSGPFTTEVEAEDALERAAKRWGKGRNPARGAGREATPAREQRRAGH